MRDMLIRLHDEVTTDSIKVMRSVVMGWISQGQTFGIGDTVAHLVQATKFFNSFVFPQVGVGEPVPLHPSLEKIKEATGRAKHDLLSTSNVENARRLRDKYSSPADLIKLYGDARAETVKLLMKVPEANYGNTVEHPLVSWDGTFVEMFILLFVVHDVEHRGNLTVLMRQYGNIVPYHSGEILDE